jgi:endonuclease-3 related protein
MQKHCRNFLKEVYNRLYNEYGPRGWWPGESPFEVMIGAVLTQNTAWANVEKAISNLKEENLLIPNRLNKISISKLTQLIKPAGYFNVKAKRLKCLLAFLFREFNGNLRLMRKERLKTLRNKLLNVNGIGPETCDSILLYALQKAIFVIDAYTRRIISRCGIINEDISYEKLQSIFMENLPRNLKLYNEYHALIVQLGKDICKKRPNCNLCVINELCKKRGVNKYVKSTY